MTISSLTRRFTAAAAALLVFWALLPAQSGATVAGRDKLAGSASAFFRQAGGPLALLPAGGPAGAGPRGTLPTSVFAHTDVVCSVDAQPVGFPECSVFITSPRRCTAYCDEANQCSVFATSASPGAGQCSALGRRKALCSVLQPARVLVGPSQCSVFNDDPGGQVFCSVVAPGDPKQACSAENPANFPGNDCSVFSSPGSSGGACSVLNGGAGFRHFCSVGRAPGAAGVSKTCSAYGDFARCSVQPGNFAICTSLLGAPAGTCSVQVAGPGSECSVIGGPGGGAVCRVP